MLSCAVSFTMPFYALSSDSKIVAGITEEKKQNPYAPPILYSDEVKSATSKSLWEQGINYFERSVVAQCRKRHAQEELQPFLDYLAAAGRNNELHCPILFRKQNLLEDLTLEFTINKETIGQYYLLHAFDKAIVELLDSSLNLLSTAKYLRSDLEILKTYFFKTCAVLKRTEFITNKLFGHSNEEFDLEEFTRNFNQTVYTPAALINDSLLEEVNKIRKNYNGTLSIDQYIKYYIKAYYTFFSNEYVFIKMHLGDQKNPDKKVLNRMNIKGSLTKDAFDLEPPSLPSLQALETPAKKKKRKNKKKSASTQTENTLSISSVEEINTQKLERQAVFTTAVINPLERSTAISTTPPTNEISFQGSQTPPVPASSNILNIASSSSQAATPLPQASQIFSSAQEISKLTQLEEILHKHDGGASAGMKTRHFLRLASALQKLGYFSHFETDQKEVKIKIDSTDQNPGLVTVMHTNHTNTSKDTGITRPTAAKMNEVIGILKEKAQSEDDAQTEVKARSSRTPPKKK